MQKHTAILELIRQGKASNSLWADEALHELNALTGQNYGLTRHYSISVLPGYEISGQSANWSPGAGGGAPFTGVAHGTPGGKK